MKSSLPFSFFEEYFSNKNKPIKIIQTSPPHTASTLLINILQGLIEPNQKGTYISNIGDFNQQIVKTHILNIDEWIKHLGSKYDLYFVCSERENNGTRKKIDKKYYSYPNVIIFDYKDIETKTQSTQKVVNFVYNKLLSFLPNSIHLNKNTAIKRVNNLIKVTKEIKNKPFTYVDEFYMVHGGHQDRNNKN